MIAADSRARDFEPNRMATEDDLSYRALEYQWYQEQDQQPDQEDDQEMASASSTLTMSRRDIGNRLVGLSKMHHGAKRVPVRVLSNQKKCQWQTPDTSFK